ncbi:hypothetical protein [Halobellus captivus]|uniref:hypothetical protein n=1 Tax=Halobellus captivus TaxID=2592614 RepID=UPI00119DB10F|nr:hypothetical protein [Halobellus captivus]
MVDPITATLGALSLGVDAASVYHQRKTAVPDGGVDEIGGVKEFWAAHRQDTLNTGSYVTVEGTLSLYAPMIFGDPRLIKQRHFEFRDALSTRAPTSIDALVSISSGQPVVRLEPMKGVYYAGLYEGIGRNSIPVFIDQSRLDSWRDRRTSAGKQVWDVALTGQLDDLPTEWDDFFSIFGLDQEAPEYAIYVQDDSVSNIEYRGETRFFEADVWAAYERDGDRGWMTRCPDFAERTEIRRSIDAIIDNLEAVDGPVELISQYDLVDRPLGTSPNIDQTATHVQEMSNRRVRENYIDEVSALIDRYT